MSAAASASATSEDKKNKWVKRLSRTFSRSKRKESVTSIDQVISPGKKSEEETKPVATENTNVLTEKKTRKSSRPIPPKPEPLSSADRAKALFKKHGLDINPSEWNFSNVAPQTERVHKDIRMRVHRNCHQCDTPFGGEKHCGKCGHRRCKECPRFPSKKHKHKEPECLNKDKYKGRLTMPSRTGGQDLIRRPVRMRVRRTCHKCETVFTRPDKICDKCNHKRCRECPRDPKKNKPPGYYDHQDPSDDECVYPGRPRRTYKKIRRRVHWTCSKCDSTFKGTKICPGCGSDRKETGIRDPPKKEKPKGYSTQKTATAGIAEITQTLKQTVLAS